MNGKKIILKGGKHLVNSLFCCQQYQILLTAQRSIKTTEDVLNHLPTFFYRGAIFISKNDYEVALPIRALYATLYHTVVLL